MMTPEGVLIFLLILAAGAWPAAVIAYRRGKAQGKRIGYPDGHDKGWKTGHAAGWHDAHRAALEVLKQWPTSRGGKAIAKALAKGQVVHSITLNRTGGTTTNSPYPFTMTHDTDGVT